MNLIFVGIILKCFYNFFIFIEYNEEKFIVELFLNGFYLKMIL